MRSIFVLAFSALLATAGVGCAAPVGGDDGETIGTSSAAVTSAQDITVTLGKGAPIDVLTFSWGTVGSVVTSSGSAGPSEPAIPTVTLELPSSDLAAIAKLEDGQELATVTIDDYDHGKLVVQYALSDVSVTTLSRSHTGASLTLAYEKVTVEYTSLPSPEPTPPGTNVGSHG